MGHHDVSQSMNHAHVVIMAGGAGTRFWPLSRRARPKQLLPLTSSGETLLGATVRRVRQLVPADRILIVTSEPLLDPTRQACPDIPADNVLAEPVGRNTAPCVGWAACHVRRRDPDGIMAVLPSDHHVGDEAAFAALVRASLDAARQNTLVTVGIRPDRPETGYGYIEMGEDLGDGVFRARRFVEKPNRARAEQFLAAGRFLWNSGMFFFQAGTVLEAIRQHLPGLADGLALLDEAAAQGSEGTALRRVYPDLPAVSFDHGVMEKAEGVSVLPGDFGWSDLGSWTTAWELADKDDDGNASDGDVIALGSSGTYVKAPPGKVVALVGVDDLIVVDTEDALLIVPRDRTQDVRSVVDALRDRDDERL
jgi:mannose-1-phosphate guanylyltransferase